MLIYGKEIREKIKEDVARSAKKIPMSMVVVRIGDDKSSQAYVNGIKNLGMKPG